ncbi:MAG: single-stranded DNA-binding protein [Moraxellaceae bacterium]|nr:single-stranded DNA-binding protein [Moraxellaceae bacterium]
MMIKLVRIGKNAELRSANGKPVLSLSVVYDVGYGANKKSQWLNLAMWGAQAEKVVEHFTKGKQLVVRVDDVHIEEYNGKSSLKGTLVGFDFCRMADANNSKNKQMCQNQITIDRSNNTLYTLLMIFLSSQKELKCQMY